MREKLAKSPDTHLSDYNHKMSSKNRQSRELYVPPTRRISGNSNSEPSTPHAWESSKSKSSEKIVHAWEVQEPPKEKIVHAWESQEPAAPKKPVSINDRIGPPAQKRELRFDNRETRKPTPRRHNSKDRKQEQPIQSETSLHKQEVPPPVKENRPIAPIRKSKIPPAPAPTVVKQVPVEILMAQMKETDWADVEDDDFDYTTVPKWNN